MPVVLVKLNQLFIKTVHDVTVAVSQNQRAEYAFCVKAEGFFML